MTEHEYQHGGERVRITGTRQGQSVRVQTDSGEVAFAWEQLAAGDYLLRDGGTQKRCLVAKVGNERWLWIDGHVHHLTVASGRAPTAAAPPPGDLLAPMPGQVLKVMVANGDAVSRSQPLLVLEAMKMQYEIVAPRDGVVAQVCVPEGAQVAAGATLVALEEEAAP